MSGLASLWQGRRWPVWALLPVALLYGGLVWLHAKLYHWGLYHARRFDVPVLVVGNLTAGGTGKSPLVGFLVECARQRGLRPGVVSRGYGGRLIKTPQRVLPQSDPADVGDEPVMHARRLGVPVCVCADRSAAVAMLLEAGNVDIVITDDGLQHHALARDAEIVVVDGDRGFGNRWLLPAGPLREPLSRLSRVDVLAVQQRPDESTSGAFGASPRQQSAMHLDSPTRAQHNGHAYLPGMDGALPPGGRFHLAPECLINLANQQRSMLASLAAQRVHAVAGLGHPHRFFAALAQAGLLVQEHPFPDHHQFSVDDVHFADDWPILVTSKDAVKLARLPIDLGRILEVQVSVCVDVHLDQALRDLVERVAGENIGSPGGRATSSVV